MMQVQVQRSISGVAATGGAISYTVSGDIAWLSTDPITVAAGVSNLEISLASVLTDQCELMTIRLVSGSYDDGTDKLTFKIHDSGASTISLTQPIIVQRGLFDLFGDPPDKIFVSNAMTGAVEIAIELGYVPSP